jgi:hypothetical protein
MMSARRSYGQKSHFQLKLHPYPAQLQRPHQAQTPGATPHPSPQRVLATELSAVSDPHNSPKKLSRKSSCPRRGTDSQTLGPTLATEGPDSTWEPGGNVAALGFAAIAAMPYQNEDHSFVHWSYGKVKGMN